MSKWKAPANFGPGCSIGGRWFDVEDDHIVVDDMEGVDFATPLTALGFVAVPEEAPDPELPFGEGEDEGEQPARTRRKRG